MKHILYIMFGILFAVSLAAMWGATIVSIGYGLYLWGGAGLPLAVAAWSAFKLFLTMLFGGLVTLAISYSGMEVTE